MHERDLLNWHPGDAAALRVFSHFVMSRTEASSVAMVHDAFLPIAGAFVGRTSAESSQWYVKLGVIGPPKEVVQEDLVAQAIRRYAQVTREDVRHVIGSTTFSLREFRAFSQRLREDDKYRIDIWLPASAACAYVALVISHLGLLLHMQAQGAPASNISRRGASQSISDSKAYGSYRGCGRWHTGVAGLRDSARVARNTSSRL
jgi:hypothetical protein